MLGKLLYKYRLPVSIFLLGFCIFGLGVFKVAGQFQSQNNTGIELVEDIPHYVVVEISGGVNSPGVYKLRGDLRVEDAILAAEGFSDDADMTWVERNINRAEGLEDGSKIYIFRQSDTNSASIPANSNFTLLGGGTGGQIDINTATQSELESLPGIGPVYAQSIIEHRPYSMVDDLLKTGAVKEHVYESVKDMVSVY